MADDNKFSDDSNVTLPIRNLISIAAAIAVSTWAYYGVIERLNVIEQKLEAHWEEMSPLIQSQLQIQQPAKQKKSKKKEQKVSPEDAKSTGNTARLQVVIVIYRFVLLW